jgi:hypothetical protein
MSSWISDILLALLRLALIVAPAIITVDMSQYRSRKWQNL